MKLTPLKHYPSPRYPTEAILRENPAFLTVVPRRWRGKPLVLGALVGVLSLSAQWQVLAQEEAAGSGSNAHVAPLFVHGDGRGAYGCMVVNPPAFLTESEAREVIENEAKKAGVSFSQSDHTIANAEIPIPYIYMHGRHSTEKNEEASAEKEMSKTFKGDLALTGYNPEKRMGYVFVSKDRAKKWESAANEARFRESMKRQAADKTGSHTLTGISHFSSVSSYHFLDNAKTLQANLTAREGDETLAVFYDPLALPEKKKLPEKPFPEAADYNNITKEEREAMDAWRNERNAPKKAASREELRQASARLPLLAKSAGDDVIAHFLETPQFSLVLEYRRKILLRIKRPPQCVA